MYNNMCLYNSTYCKKRFRDNKLNWTELNWTELNWTELNWTNTDLLRSTAYVNLFYFMVGIRTSTYDFS